MKSWFHDAKIVNNIYKSEKIPWNPCIRPMKQKSFYLLKSAVPPLA